MDEEQTDITIVITCPRSKWLAVHHLVDQLVCDIDELGADLGGIDINVDVAVDKHKD
jgi:hypothetical protein